MTDRGSALALAPRVREGGGGRTRREYLDFVVDGRSPPDRAGGGDVVGVLGWLSPEHEREAIQALRPGAAGDGRRVPLYVCPECGDLGCGAIVASVAREADRVVWSDFAWETDGERGEAIPGIGPFRFSHAAYGRLLHDRLLALEADARAD